MKTATLHRLVLLTLLVIGFAVLSYVSLVVFCDYPYSMDEYNYLYQARIFSSGRLYLSVNKGMEDLFEAHMFFWDGRLFSKYPPGFSLILALGVKLGIPGLINPLLSVLTILLIYLIGAQLVGSRFSLLALPLIISNIYFLGYGASYFNQPASLFSSTLTLFFYQRYRVTKKINFLSAAGLVICLQTLIRPVDALCLWAAVCLYLGAGQIRKTLKPLIIFCVLSALGVVLLLIYNKMMAGKWGIAPYPVWNSDFKLFYAEGGSVPVFRQIALFLKAYLLNLKRGVWLPLVRYFLPYLICWVPLIVLSFFGKRDRNPDLRAFVRILFIYGLLLVAFYNVHPANVIGWPQYGARYWYPLLVALGLLLAEGLRVLYGISPRKIFWIIFGVFILWQVYQSVYYLGVYSERFKAIQAIRADINAHCPPKSIVVLHKDEYSKRGLPPFMSWIDLRRNPFFSGDRLYITENRHPKEIQNSHPEYSICDYYF